jgi:hypothetical protein
MSIPVPSTAIVRYEPALSEAELTTIAGFLAAYRGHTVEAYALDLRQFTAWCLQRGRHLFEVRRVDIECFARDLEDAGKARATVARRLCTIIGFYRYAEEEGAIDRSPGVHIRRPRVDYESHVVGLDRNEVGALLVSAGLSSPRDHALVSLMALNGLRVSEVVSIDIDALGLERGHRTLTVLRKGGKTATIRSRRGSPAPSTSPSGNGPRVRSSSTPRVNDWTATPLGGSCGAPPANLGSSSGSGRTPCGMPSSPPPSMRESRCVTCKKPPATPTHERRCDTTVAASRWTATPPTSSPRSSRAHPADNPCAGVRGSSLSRTRTPTPITPRRRGGEAPTTPHRRCH